MISYWLVTRAGRSYIAYDHHNMSMLRKHFRNCCEITFVICKV